MAATPAAVSSRLSDPGHDLEGPGTPQGPAGRRQPLALANSRRGLDEILGYLVAQAQRTLGADGASLYLVDPVEPQVLHIGAHVGVPEAAASPTAPLGLPMIRLAVSSQRTVVAADCAPTLAPPPASSRDQSPGPSLDQPAGSSLDQPAAPSVDQHLVDRGAFLEVVDVLDVVDVVEGVDGVRAGPTAAGEPAHQPHTQPLQTQPLTQSHTQPLRQPRTPTVRTIAAVPLSAQDATYGALVLHYRQPHAFATEQTGLSQAFAHQAALAIENARLRAQAEHRLAEIVRRQRVAEGLRDLLAIVNSTRSLDEILDHVLAQASDLLGSAAGSVLLLDDRDGHQGVLTVRASRDLVSEVMPTRLPVSTGITGVAVDRQRPVGVSDLLDALPVAGRSEPIIEERPGYLALRRIGDSGTGTPDNGRSRAQAMARHYRALLAVPLMARGRIQGAITLYYRQPCEFSREDIELAQVFADQTALAIENANLYGHAMRRTRDLEALYRADEALYRSLRLDQVLQALVDVAADVLQADMTSVLVWDAHHERLVPGATRGFRPETVARMAHVPGGPGVTIRVAMTGEPISVADAMHDPRVAHAITDAEGIRSLLHVPIKVNGQVFGVFGVNYRQPRALHGDEERVLLALAHRAAVAIENASLYAESEQRRQELEAVYRADELLHGSLRLDDVLRTLVDVAADVLQADKVSVHVLDPDGRALQMAASRGYGPGSVAETLHVDGEPSLEGIRKAGVVVVQDLPNLHVSSRLAEIAVREGVRSGVVAPITVLGTLFGLFGIGYSRPHAVTPDEQRLAKALAQRAGLAIHNARLFEQAQQAATTEERQRLARELHDAVTQTLFSASLIAEVVPRLWERDPDEARRRLDELRRLTRGALAEMRTLLLELRPVALVETPFMHLLQQLGEAMASRANLSVEVSAHGEERPLPGTVQIALYRIAQEALNNVGKHAGAQGAQVQVWWAADAVEMRVSDNGHGFIKRSVSAGRLGLGIMHERARSIGARLRIDSQLGRGTRVHVRWRSSGG